MGRRPASSSSSGVCSCCTRVFLVLLNLLLLLAALALIAVIFWQRYDTREETNLRQLIMAQNSGNVQIDEIKSDWRFALTIAFWVVFGIAVAAALICALGIIAGTSGSRCLLGFFMSTLILLILVELAVGIFMIIYRNTKIHESVNKFVNLAINIGDQDSAILRQRFNCCGADGVNNFLCQLGQPTCTRNVWDRVDYVLMVSGIVLIAIIVLQVIKLVLTIGLLATSSRRRETVQ